MCRYDVIIIGAGITGSSIARLLSQYDLRILWIEKHSDICMGTSSANSAIIHAGYDAYPGTLKATTNVAGNKLWPKLAGELDIPYLQCGSFVLAEDTDGINKIKLLYERGLVNGVSGLEIIDGAELRRRCPQLSERICAALFAPTAGVIDPFEAVIALAENAVTNSVELMLETEFEDFIIEDGTIKGIVTNKGEFGCRWVINCAGLYSDEVMHKAGVHLDFKIRPRRGEYIIFDPMHIKLDSVFFPTPSEKGKGILITTTTHGNVMAGPNSWFVDSKEDTDVTSQGIKEVFESARRFVPSLDLSAVIAQYAGLRATGNFGEHHDFLIELSNEVHGLINLAGIESPGFAAAPAIAQKVVKLLSSKEKLIEKKDWNPVRKRRPAFRELSHQQRAELIKKNPAYGRIVCRCECVTEGEIIDAINGVIPATTYDAIKRRTWLGTGRCQGGFDYNRVIEILAKQLNRPITQITKKGPGSQFVYRMTKETDGIRCDCDYANQRKIEG